MATRGKRAARAPLDALQSPFSLEGRTALVTGAGRGIGRSCALALAQAGAEVWLVARSGDEVNQVAAEIRESGAQARAVACDVTDLTAVRRTIAAIPVLDILVNNAGTNIPEPFLEITEAHLDFLLDLNVRAMFLVAQAAASKMLEHPARVSRGAAILNMSSQMGHRGQVNRTVYVMAKHAIEGLTKAMALELTGRGIRVVSIAPTVIDTPMIASRKASPDFAARVVARIPLGRIGMPEEVAAAVVFAASPAAALLTGSSLLLDGGWTAQ